MQCCDRIVLMPIRIRISILIPSQIWIRVWASKTLPILMRKLPQVLLMLENQNFYFTFNHNIATLQCFIFLISVKCVMFQYLDSILKFAGTETSLFFINLSISLKLIPIRICRIRIRQNDACGSDPIPIKIQIYNAGESLSSPWFLKARDRIFLV